MMFTEPTHWKTTGRFDSIVSVMNQVKVARGWGDCYGHAMVATGRAEVAIDPLMSPWDIAALIPILREAGGTCTDWKGVETVTGGDGVSVVPGIKRCRPVCAEKCTSAAKMMLNDYQGICYAISAVTISDSADCCSDAFLRRVLRWQ